MDDKELLRLIREYNPDKDIENTDQKRYTAGDYGHFLADLILLRFSDCSDLKKAIMRAHLSGLEYESLQHEALLRQNN